MTEERAQRELALRVRDLLLGWRLRVVPLLRGSLPVPARRGLRHLDEWLDPVRRFLYRRLTGDSRRVPPRLLRERVGAPTIESYFATGERWAATVELGLAAAERRLADCSSVLEFGCGAGKVIRHLEGRGAGELDGCDIHEGSIEWLDAKLPAVKAVRNAVSPPLPYPDAYFDCIYAWSVFTHLDRAAQDQWLLELRRILAPEGTLLISVLGEDSPAIFEAQGRLDRLQLSDEGVLFFPYVDRGASYSEFAGSDQQKYGLTYVTREHIRERWSHRFEVVRILPLAFEALQDVVVLSPLRADARRGKELGDASQRVANG